MRGSGCWRDSIVVFFIAASSVFVGTQSARAASITCPALIGNSPHIADNVTPSTGCEIGGTNNDFLGSDPTLFQVNVDAMFGFNDWQFAGKAFEAESGLDIGLSVTGVASSGYGGYQGWNQPGYGTYGYHAGADLKFECKVYRSGQIRDIDIKRREARWRGY